MKVCSKHNIEKTMLESKTSVTPKFICTECKRVSSNKSINKDLTQYIFNTKKANAKRANVVFTILKEDIVFPTVCPVLGIALDYPSKSLGRNAKPSPSSPSFDRIDNSKGYVKGNVLIVSNLANRIKAEATPEQILQVGNYYLGLLTT